MTGCSMEGRASYFTRRRRLRVACALGVEYGHRYVRRWLVDSAPEEDVVVASPAEDVLVWADNT